MPPSPEKGELAHVITHYLASVGIPVRPGKTSPSQDKKTLPPPAGSLFGVPLHLLPLSEHVDGVPQFLVDACELLRPHLHIEGLFRKCGSMTRIKALKTRLEAGERCLEMALPCDVATLVKQFLRGLPEPLIPARLQGPLCLVQQREDDDENRGPLILLLTCLLPQRSTDTLRYFFSFLQDVAARCAQNKMDLANLAVIFAPNLFPGEVCSQLGGGTEDQLQAQAAVVQVLISHAPEIGTPPQPLLEKVQSAFSDEEIKRPIPPGPGNTRENGVDERRRRRRKRGSVGNIVTEALSKFKTGRAFCPAPCQEIKEDFSRNTTLKTSFISKRKASEDDAWAPELLAKKRRSALDCGSSVPFDENVGDALHQPTDVASVQASTSPIFSGGTLNPVSDAGSGPDSSRTLVVNVQRRRSSGKKHSQRKRSVHMSPCCSPTSFERKDTGRKSLRLFSRNSKDLQSLPVSAKAAEPTGWLLMKKMVTEALEGPGSQQRGPRLQSYTAKGSEGGSLIQPSNGNTYAPACANPEAPHAVKGKACTGPSPRLGDVISGHRQLDAPVGSGGLLDNAEALAGEMRLFALSTPRHRGVLRRSMSWPEELSVRGVAEESMADFFRADAPVTLGGREAQTSGLAEQLKSGVEDIVSGMRELGIPATCVTQADDCAAGCLESSRPGGLSQSPHPSKPGLSNARLSLASRFRRLNEGPKTSLKCLTLSLPHTSSLQPDEGPNPGRLSLCKHKGGRRFGRSISHESGLPLQAGQQEGFAGQSSQTVERGTPLRPSKNPLQSFKAYGRQFFISRKHVMMSFAGLRGKREEPSSPGAEVSSPDWSTC